MSVSKKAAQYKESWSPKTNHKRYLATLINEKLYRMVSICQEPDSLLWMSLSGYRQSKAETESNFF